MAPGYIGAARRLHPRDEEIVVSNHRPPAPPSARRGAFALRVMAAVVLLAACGTNVTTKVVGSVTTSSATTAPNGPTTTGAGASQDEAIDATLAGNTGSAPDLLREVQRIVAAKKESTYAHKTHVVEAGGVFDLDCSGLIDYALKRVNLRAYRDFPLSKPSAKRPLAQDIYGYLAAPGASSQWHRVLKTADLQPGDVIAWLRPPDNETANTGHVMVVAEVPTANPAFPGEMLVRIIDSTESPHASDTRPTGTAGVGSGVIGIIDDASGSPVSYRWRGGVSRKEEATPIAFGRLVGLGSAATSTTKATATTTTKPAATTTIDPTAPTLSASVSPKSISCSAQPSGAMVTVTWSARNAASVSIGIDNSGPYVQGLPLSGSYDLPFAGCPGSSKQYYVVTHASDGTDLVTKILTVTAAP
jgi:hypothetical protein